MPYDLKQSWQYNKKVWLFVLGFCLFIFILGVAFPDQQVAKTFQVTFSLTYPDMTLEQAAAQEAALRSRYKDAKVDVKVAERTTSFSTDSLILSPLPFRYFSEGDSLILFPRPFRYLDDAQPLR